MKMCERMMVLVGAALGLLAGLPVAVGAATTNRVLVTGPASFSFSPAVLNIKVGDTVLWTNVSSTTHDVTQGTQLGGAAPNPYWSPVALSLLGRGSVTFSNGGAYPYICNTHVKVNPQPGPQTGLVNVAYSEIRLTPGGMESGGFRFTYSADPGQRYVIEGSRTADTPMSYQPLATNTATTAVQTFVDPGAVTVPGRVYRVFRRP